MRRLTDNDKNFGPFTLARWSKRFAVMLSSGDEDDDFTNSLTLNAFGWALRIQIPRILQPLRIRKEAVSWDAETIARLGRNWYDDTHEREFGFALSNMGNGYDFLQLNFGAQTMDSSTTEDWCCHLPWKQWACVRNSVYTPTGEHFAAEDKGKGRFFEFMRKKDECPACHFGFEDYDGEMIVATCVIEEREWNRGEGAFKWLKWFYPRKIRRSLDLKFSAEVGPEKGSWNGGTTGHGIDMEPGETPRAAFERYCAMEHDARRGRAFRLRFIGPCEAPPPKPRDSVSEDCQNAKATRTK